MTENTKTETGITLTLFVSGQAPRNQRVAAALEGFFGPLLQGRGRLSVVDVLQQPELAEAADVIVTPTLVASFEGNGEKRVIGNLADVERVAVMLSLEP
ncbi:MAG: circadian clock protein KaiB [Gammaproteobacteria bacterium]|nr:circadian clock protein KaiB [Gammaproteobacteria bacterium]MCP5135656.1 circadian clock protein KaiB [Gammaproteobacteria bacterium]